MDGQRAIIFANGVIEKPERVSLWLKPEDFLVAADGGFHHLQGLGLAPDIVIGDLDSLLPEDLAEIEKKNVHILRYPPEKDETDLELALQYVISQGFVNIRIVGALGGRFDHALGNLSLLLLPELFQRDVRFDDGLVEVFLIEGSGSIQGQVGDGVSLIPFGQPVKQVTTEGLRYPLKGETLFPDKTRGISNVLIREKAFVQLGSGVLICIHTRSGLI